MSYYLFLDGKRYDGSLVKSARFRLGGQGDGRISKSDSQELWRQAMDGGRLTETEEDTLRYLLREFNWTSEAANWIKEKLDQERTKVKSYYKVIDGLRYDRKILEEAENMTSGQGDGRISLEDAKFLLPLFGDMGDVRVEEERALEYVLDQYSWTDKARDWFLPRVSAISKEAGFFGLVAYIVKYEFDLQRLSVEFDRDVLHRQTLALPNRIDFPEAVRRALRSLLEDDKDSESLRNLVVNIFELFPEVDNWEQKLEDKIREVLDDSRLILLDQPEEDDEEEQDYYPPENGENIFENWIFGLATNNLSDHLIWVIVPRDGKGKAYNYGFN